MMHRSFGDLFGAHLHSGALAQIILHASDLGIFLFMTNIQIFEHQASKLSHFTLYLQSNARSLLRSRCHMPATPSIPNRHRVTSCTALLTPSLVKSPLKMTQLQKMSKRDRWQPWREDRDSAQIKPGGFALSPVGRKAAPIVGHLQAPLAQLLHEVVQLLVDVLRVLMDTECRSLRAA